MLHSHEIRPFKADHVSSVAWPERLHAERVAQTVQDAVRVYEKFPGYSGFCDGRFVGAAGIVSPYRGLGEAWAIVSPLAQSHRTFFHRTVKRLLPVMARDMGLRRLQVLVRSDFETSQQWVRHHLGFTYEGTMAKYGVFGEDMDVYVMFPKEEA